MSERGDVIDRGTETGEQFREAAEQAVREAAALIPAGEAGDCELCGHWSGRLVGGACAPCRDKYGLP